MDDLSPSPPKRRAGNPNMRAGAISVNPRGAPRKMESLATACREAVSPAELAAKMLALADGAESEQVRYSALAWLAERAHGKVASVLDATLTNGNTSSAYDLDSMTHEAKRELLQRIRAIKRLDAGDPTPTEGQGEP